MMKGYHVHLIIYNAGPALAPVRVLLVKEGYTLIENSSIQRTQELLERYSKEPPGIQKSFFDRKADYSVHVDVIYSVGDAPNVEIRIYNLYIGNDPNIKPALLETASQIENVLRETIPEVKIIRNEGLAGLPWI